MQIFIKSVPKLSAYNQRYHIVIKTGKDSFIKVIGGKFNNFKYILDWFDRE
jgi:hypothetical protein